MVKVKLLKKLSTGDNFVNVKMSNVYAYSGPSYKLQLHDSVLINHFSLRRKKCAIRKIIGTIFYFISSMV